MVEQDLALCPNTGAYAFNGGPSGMTNRVSHDKAIFVAFCAYLASQAIMVPFVPLGPWPLWPRLSDIAFFLLVIAWLFTSGRKSIAVGSARRLVIALYVMVGLLATDYAIFTVLAPNLWSVELWTNDGLRFGFFSLFRMAQFAVLVHIVAGIQVNRDRSTSLARLAGVVLLLVVVGVSLTSLSVVSTSTFAPFLPSDLPASGPWHAYVSGTESHSGGGTISHNHGYAAIQMLVLLGLYLQLRGPESATADSFIVVMTGFGVLLSGSRSGILSFMVFVLLYMLLHRRTAGLFALILGSMALLVMVVSMMAMTSYGTLAPILERQLAVFRSPSSSNLSGRDAIWETVIESFVDWPFLSWIFGTGFGSSAEFETNAHMLFLQYLIEFGMLGTALIGVAFAVLLARLWGADASNRSMFCTTVALLLGSLTQETFYPVVAFGGFLGLYLSTVAITLAVSDNSEPERHICSRSDHGYEPVAFTRSPANGD
jgi:hypothetical protein